MRHTYLCPDCDQVVQTDAAWRARGRGRPCRACVRVRTGWSCQECGATDPHHDDHQALGPLIGLDGYAVPCQYPGCDRRSSERSRCTMHIGLPFPARGGQR